MVDIYEYIRDEVEASHPWNFAIKRAELTVLGGEVTTWTASGTTNVWQAALTTEPARVEFDGIEGDEQTSAAACTAVYNWFWESNILYAYSTSDPDTAFSTINAFIPEFDWDYAYSLPSDYLRAIHTEDDVKFVREGIYILSNESELKIKYIAQITDETLFSPAFVVAFAQRLAAEAAFALTTDPKTVEAEFNVYKEKSRMAKGIDAQEGIGEREETIPWDKART